MQKNFKKTPMARWVSTSLAVAALSGAAIAATPLAGTLIKNYATVVYTDASGIQRSVQSNEAVVEVAPVYFAKIEDNLTKTAAPGNTVYLAHTLTNTGNIADTYTLTASNGGDIYLDLNGDGQPSAGEVATTSVSVDAGQSVSLVVEHAVPANATDGTAYSVELTAASSAPNVKITDPDPDAPTDTGSVTSTITVSLGAVIASTKSMAYDNKGTEDPSDDEITYTLTAKNTGQSKAQNVVIVDAIPTFLNTSGQKVAATVTSISVNGLLADNDDVVPQVAKDFDESTAGISIDNNPALETVPAVLAVDKELPPNTEVSVVFTISLAGAKGGEEVENAYLVYSADPALTITDPNPTDPNQPVPPASLKPKPIDPTNPDPTVVAPGPSNKVAHEIVPVYGVVADDATTGLATVLPVLQAADPTKTEADVLPAINGATAPNDGKDDTMTTDVPDTQYVDSVGSGAEVLYQVVIRNTGNADGTFSLEEGSGGTFPSGTIFSYWNADGTVQLANIADTGAVDIAVPQGDFRTVTIKATLPVGFSDEAPAAAFNQPIKVTNHSDNSVTDNVDLALGKITAPKVDIALESTPNTTGDDDPQGAVNFTAGSDTDAFANDISVGGTATFDIKVVNEGTSPMSYILDQGTNFPDGWQVQFTEVDGTPTNVTPTLQPGVAHSLKAVVTVSVDPSKALGDAAADPVRSAGNFDLNINPSATDTDLDYVFGVTATSALDTSIKDEITLVVDVATSRIVEVSPATATQQTQAGGSLTYPVTVSNTGNEDEPVTLSIDSPWEANLVFLVPPVDASGVADLTDPSSFVPTNIENLVALIAPVTGTPVIVVDQDGNYKAVNITAVTPATPTTPATVELTLEPGDKLELENIVSSPSNAKPGETNTAIVSVEKEDGTTDTSKAISLIVADQVRLVKTASIDSNCDGVGNTAFEEAQSVAVKPGECVTWRIQATNAGTTKVTGAEITDTVPAFTTYLANSDIEGDGAVETSSMMYCADNTCAAPVLDSNAGITNDVIAFNIQYPGTDPATGSAYAVGELPAGAIYTVSFTTKVDSDN